MSKGKLVLVPIVISENTSSSCIPLSVHEYIRQIDYYLVENIRTARRFISSLKLGVEIEKLQFEVLDKNVTSDQLPHLFKPLFSGRDIAIMSEAGCPGVADPGSIAVEYAHQKDIEVVPLVGPSSILMTLMASGFNGQSFVFHGYLPIEKKERQMKIKSMEKDAIQKSQTQIFMDTPYRNEALLKDILNNCESEMKLCIARDITGDQEFIKTRSIAQWKAESLPSLHKIPTMFAIYR